jgi:hypothetical protein
MYLWHTADEISKQIYLLPGDNRENNNREDNSREDNSCEVITAKRKLLKRDRYFNQNQNQFFIKF